MTAIPMADPTRAPSAVPARAEAWTLRLATFAALGLFGGGALGGHRAPRRGR